MIVEKQQSLVRVNTRISKTLNDWLDNESAKTGVSKSNLIFLATEQYKLQKETLENMKSMSDVVFALERLEKKIEKIENND